MGAALAAAAAALLVALGQAGDAPAPAPAPSEPVPRGEEAAAPATGVLTRAPELEQFVPAEYPPDALAAGVEGSVVLSIVIGEDGEVKQAVVEDPGPHPGFAAAALHAVTQFRFRPAEIDGKPAAVEITYRYEFVLRKAPTPAAPAEAPVLLSGRVVERGTRAPVAGAAVEAGGVATETDADGRFALRGLPAGDVLVRVVSPAHQVLALHESIDPGKRREVEYRLTRRHYDPYEAVVRADRPRREISVQTLDADEVRTLPGTQGDVLKVIQDLPGVARSPFGIGLLVVRGSEPNDSAVFVDGVQVPILFHFGGLTSVVNSDVVEALDFYPGNFGVRFGRAIGGAVEVRTREPKAALHGAAQVDVFDGRAEVEGPLGEATGYLALRRSWVDAVLAVALPRIDATAANDLRVAPRYYDYQAKASFALGGGTASIAADGSDDALEYVQPGDRPGRPSFYLHTGFHRLVFSWKRPVGGWLNDAVLSGGYDGFNVLQATNFGVLTDVGTFALRDELSWRRSEDLTVRLGIDTQLRAFSYKVYAPPTQPPGQVGGSFGDISTTLGEHVSGTWLSPGAYAEADWRALPRLRVVGGLRVDSDTRLRSAGAWADPRLSAFVDVARGTTLMAAAGLFGQAPAPQYTDAVVGNPDLRAERALHLSAGVRQALPASLRLEVTPFYKRMWDLVVPTRSLGAGDEPLRFANTGRGEAVGVEVLLRRELAQGVFGWIAYTLSRSTRQDDPTLPPYPSWHLFPLDQTHILTAVVSYRLPGDWILGTRVRAVTGNPYTPTDGHVLDADTGRFQCLPSPSMYSSRLPAFFQADARLDKRWVFERWMFSMYLDVQNVTNRQNAELRFNNYDCTQQVSIPSLPIFPALGLRAEW